MKRIFPIPYCRRIGLGLMLAGLLIYSQLGAQSESTSTTDAHSLSPYLFVKSRMVGEVIPLKSTSVHVDLAALFASVKVRQVYANEGTTTLEAIYIFPGSTRAAVHAMRLTVGERVTEAVLKERSQAIQTYETAKREGKTASLLEEHRPNVFQMSVANILPGDTVTVELEYSEFIVPEEGRYQFVYPGVVGPRYVSSAHNEGETWTANPYLGEGEPDVATFSLDVAVASPVPLAELRCLSHNATINFTGEKTGTVAVPQEDNGSNRDFVLQYRLTGPAIQTGILTAQVGDENFFLMTVQPPKRIQSAQVLPRDYVFVLDVSGSMNGFPLETANASLRQLIGNLRQGDTFNVVLFAGTSAVFAENPIAATSDNLRRALAFIDEQHAGGGTELLPALQTVYALPKHEENMARSIVILTDGYVSVENEAFAMIRNNLSQASVFSFGVGSSVNRHLIEGMARAGQGEPFIVLNATEGEEEVERLRRYLESPVLTGLKLERKGVELYDVEGGLTDVLAERPMVFCGKWKGAASGEIRIEAFEAGGKEFSIALDLGKAGAIEQPELLQRLWARMNLQTLQDAEAFDETRNRTEHREAIIEHSLHYGLLSPYTAFVAVDQVVRNPKDGYKSVKQPLPLPQGATVSALGGAGIATTPEPAELALFATALAACAGMILRRYWKQRDSLRTR